MSSFTLSNNNNEKNRTEIAVLPEQNTNQPLIHLFLEQVGFSIARLVFVQEGEEVCKPMEMVICDDTNNCLASPTKDGIYLLCSTDDYHILWKGEQVVSLRKQRGWTIN